MNYGFLCFLAWLPFILFFFLLILLPCYRCVEVSFELDLRKGLLLCAPDLTEDTVTWIEAQDGGWQRLELDSRLDVTGPK
jgi:hypothetical protein